MHKHEGPGAADPQLPATSGMGAEAAGAGQQPRERMVVWCSIQDKCVPDSVHASVDRIVVVVEALAHPGWIAQCYARGTACIHRPCSGCSVKRTTSGTPSRPPCTSSASLNEKLPSKRARVNV